jgi:diguanylate cyclase (GGDEF)-like protein
MFDAGAMSGGRILIVDDEPANVRLLERLLMTGGFTDLRSTTDARQALAIASEFSPDLIMLDLNMPHVDGFAIMAEVRARSSPGEYLPVLVLTADMTLATKERALSNGATDFLTKPFERTEVLLRSRNLLESRYLHLRLKDENKTLESKLAHQAFHDSLTGLANRALFRDRVEHALARAARGVKCALLMLDLDDFKAVNDGLGHGEGDRLLKVIADRLVQVTRECDTVARLGGDEFVILLDNIRDAEDVLLVVGRIMDAMRLPVALEGRDVVIGASIGIAHARPEDSIDELLRNADVAMYRAKEDGKARYAVFEQAMYSAMLERIELQSDLQHAVGRGELRVLYQPIVDLRSGRITGLEALVRWKRPDQGEASPATFIPLAEETGLIVPIGRWVMTEAARQAQAWRIAAGTGRGPTISVNVSARQLYDPNFTTDVATLLGDTGLPPDRLILEITESALVSNPSAMTRLQEIKSIGVRIAIDDFGMGYSNLASLQRLPLDIIKIDRSFIANSDDNGALMSIIVDMAATLELQTVAEGIEQDTQRDQVIALGCTQGQGFLFSRPVTADAITELMVAQNGMPAEETTFGRAGASTSSRGASGD